MPAKGKEPKTKTVDKVLIVDVSQTTKSRGTWLKDLHRAWASRNLFAVPYFLLDLRSRFIDASLRLNALLTAETQRTQRYAEEKSCKPMGADSNNRLRVLLVAPSLDIIGGQSRQAVRLREGLSHEPDLEVSFLPHNPRLPGILRFLQAIKFVRTVVTTFAYILLLLFRVRKYDIIHIFCASYYSYSLSAIPALFIARLYGKKSILNYRSGEAEDHLENWRTAVPTLRWADEIVVPSGYLVDVFARHGLHARAIYNIVELDRFSFRERNPLRPVFLTSRLLEPLYNVACVLRAFAIIQQRYPDATLTIAADGYLRNDLETLARDLKLRNANFIGFVLFADMPALYDSADIYLSATSIDNMPSSLTESMACGLNVVTTDGGGAIPYIMTNEVTGLIVDRDDHQALANAAIRLLNDNEFALKLVRNAHESSRKFTWPHIRNEWLNLYKELANPMNPANLVNPVQFVRQDLQD
jgi:L-malate glycosyltransferase